MTSSTSSSFALVARRSPALRGEALIPGDKSISHRALMLGALAVGKTRITGLLEGEDVLGTAAAMQALGAEITRREESPGTSIWEIWGRGVGGLTEPSDVLDFGNSGTGVRLCLGILAGHPFTTFVRGDASLSSRPMERIFAPLRLMGAEFLAHRGGRLPAAVTGQAVLKPLRYKLPVASAQIKSAILLAGLSANGTVEVLEDNPSRDHSERMLRHFGAALAVEDLPEGRVIGLAGGPELRGQEIAVPGDPSSAAFPLVAALITPGSKVLLRGVGLNPLRTGLIECLLEMGAAITFHNRRESGGEPVADLEASYSSLKGIEVPPERSPSMIDEYPILAIAAAAAEGPTRMLGLAELRHKESDRLAAVATGLAACGLKVTEGPDSLVVEGTGGVVAGAATIAAKLDHRIAMAFAILGLIAKAPITIDDATAVATSFPTFLPLMQALGAEFECQGPTGGQG